MKRRRRADVAPALTLAKVGIPGTLAFFSGMAPKRDEVPHPRPPRWPTWSAYLKDYRAVRAEFRRRFPGRVDAFAEVLHQRARADRTADIEELGELIYEQIYLTDADEQEIP